MPNTQIDLKTPVPAGNLVASIGGLIEVTTTFMDKKKAPTYVYNPKATFKQGDIDVTDSIEILTGFGPTGLNVGEYKMTFITSNWTPGTYKVTLLGYTDPEDKDGRESSKLTSEGIFQVTDMSPKQGHIDLLRMVLADDIPQFYVIDDPTKFRFQDGQLFSFLKMSVSQWNSTPPVSTGSQNSLYVNPDKFDRFPFMDLLITGAELIALNRETILEILNTLEYTDDITFRIDRAPKFMQKYQMLQTWYTQRLEKAKKDAAMRLTYSMGASALLSTRLPFRIIRALCHDIETECLTEKGFKKYTELTYNDEIATMNPDTNLLEYQKPEDIFIYDYIGPMYHYRGNETDMNVTPNHRMWICENDKEKYQMLEAKDIEELPVLCKTLLDIKNIEKYLTTSCDIVDISRLDISPYKGKVWCVRVPNGIFITRRNNKIAIQGNSFNSAWSLSLGDYGSFGF